MQLDCGLISRTRTPARGSRVKLFLLAATVAVLIAPSAALADATLSPGLRDRAAANPDAVFRIIVQGEPGQKSKAIGNEVVAVTKAQPGSGLGMKRGFLSIDGVSAELTGQQILRLAGNARDRDDHRGHAGACHEPALEHPALALLLGSGAALADVLELFAQGAHDRRRRLRYRIRPEGFPEPGPAHVDLTSLPNNSPGDGRGHGTFVASIAAGGAAGYAGASPNAKLVSLDVIDDSGMGLTSDVIAAADWILENKARYNIRVANFSLTGSTAVELQVRSSRQGCGASVVQRCRGRHCRGELRRPNAGRALCAG